MNKETIDNAAWDYAEGIQQDEYRKKYSWEDFKAGAEWRVNSVWHDASDIAEPGKDCLVEHMYEDGNVCIRIDRRSEYEWINACYYDKILRWAYISDLFPERK